MAYFAAPLVALASMIGTGLGGRTPFWSVKTAFNVGAVPLSMAAGSWTFVLLGGTSGAGSNAILPLLAAAIVYALINVPLTATAVALGSGRCWIAIVRQAAVLALLSNITCALAGAGLLMAWVVVGPIGLALGLVPLAPLEEYARSLSRLAGREEKELPSRAA